VCWLSIPPSLVFSPVYASCADTPAPPVGLSALTQPPQGRLTAVLLRPARRAGPHPRRSAGARRRGRGTCPQFAAPTSALRLRARAGPEPVSTNGGTVPGRSWTESALRAGCRAQRARSALSRDPRFVRRARGPPWVPLRRRRRSGGHCGSLEGAGGGDVTCVPRPRRPGWAQRKQGSGEGGAWCPPCMLTMPSGRPNTFGIA
jgi:hypothetical protein